MLRSVTHFPRQPWSQGVPVIPQVTFAPVRRDFRGNNTSGTPKPSGCLWNGARKWWQAAPAVGTGRLTQAGLWGEPPRGSSSLTMSRWLWWTATCRGVRPFCGRRQEQPRLSWCSAWRPLSGSSTVLGSTSRFAHTYNLVKTHSRTSLDRKSRRASAAPQGHLLAPAGPAGAQSAHSAGGRRVFGEGRPLYTAAHAGRADRARREGLLRPPLPCSSPQREQAQTDSPSRRRSDARPVPAAPLPAGPSRTWPPRAEG